MNGDRAASVPAAAVLPPGLLENARELAAGRLEIAPARPAATVVLLRDGDDGPEAYLLRRVPTMAFAAGMHVFPGGRVDERDEQTGDRAWHRALPQSWPAALSADPELAAALVCAAVRETFEESGVLLAGLGPDEIVADTRGADWETDRQALLSRSLPFTEMLRRRGLTLRADLLRPWAHWITPEVEPRRYDTRFFVAALPEGQRTRDVGGEADRVVWMRPADAVERAERGQLDLLPPTATTLAEIAPYASVADILAAAATRTIQPVMPRLRVGDGDGDDDVALLFPGDDGYEAAPP